MTYTDRDDYLWTMSGRGRLLALMDGEQVCGYCTYVMVHDEAEAESLFRRDYKFSPPEETGGSMVFIDQLMTSKWDRSLLRQVQELITQRHPSWTQGIWYRHTPRGWRVYTLGRGGAFYGHQVVGPCRQPVRVGAA